MNKKIEKRKIHSDKIDDNLLLNYIKYFFYKKFFTTKYTNFQKLIDDYFYEKGKEVKYFFIFDEDKNLELEEEINKTDNEDRKLELEMLRFGLAYNREDIFTFGKRYNYEKIYEIIEKSTGTNKAILYNSIIFEDEYIILTYKDLKDKETVKNKILINKNEDFNKYLTKIQENGLSKYYIIDKDKYIIKLNTKLKSKITKQVNNDISLKEKFKGLFKQKDFNKLEIKKVLDSYLTSELKIEEDKIITNEKLTYVIIGNINNDKIEHNKTYLETSEEEIIGLMNITKYNKLFENNNSISNFLEKVSEEDIKKTLRKEKEKKEEKTNNLYLRFISKIEGEIEYITNYKIFKEKVINNKELSEELKNELTEFFKKSLPIYGITLSGRQDKKSSTQPPIFEIYQKTLNEGIQKIFTNNFSSDLIEIDKDININFGNLELEIKKIYDEDIGLKYKTRIEDRITKYCSSIYAYPINK